MKKLAKKKGFVIDKISEDSFYENLLLGLTTQLKKGPFVSQIALDRHAPATVEEISGWEHANSFQLPEDMRNFYLSTNGFCLSYKFQYDKNDDDEVSHVMCGIEILPLPLLVEIQPKDSQYLTETGVKISVPHSKIFILAQMHDDNCVVMAQFNPSKPPNFWLYYKMKIFYLLCEDFSTYFRMALAHLGIPGWQMAALKASLPDWSSEIFEILAPGVLNRRTVDCSGEINTLDATLFDDFEEIPVEGDEGGSGRRRSGKKQKM